MKQLLSQAADQVVKSESGARDGLFSCCSKYRYSWFFYSGDEEFPAAARLLIDQAAVKFLEFEFLAVLATIFVEQLIAEMPSCKYRHSHNNLNSLNHGLI